MKKYIGILLILLCIAFNFSYAEADEKVFSTSYNENNSISVDISDKTLLLNFPDNGYFDFVMLILYCDEDTSYNQMVYDTDNTIEYYVGDVPEGNYYLEIYTAPERYTVFWSYMFGKKGIKLSISDTSVEFVMAEIYDDNEKLFQAGRSDQKALSYYLQPSYGIESDHEDIISLAEEITKVYQEDYDKLKAIHDWVCNNIWYDYDVFYGRSTINGAGALETLNSRKSVCQGYASLTAALLRAAGIPAKLVSGYALGVSGGSEWTDEIISSYNSNHAWNEAYISGRWIILDTTWDSDNKYENGKFSDNTGLKGYKYFDISLELLSYDHRIMSDDSEVEKAVGPATDYAAPTAREAKKTLYTGYENYTLRFNNLESKAAITYKTSNKKVATVSAKGVVKPVGKGTAIITASIKQNGESYTVKIIIIVKNPSISITGSVNELTAGKSITLKTKIYGLKKPVIEWTSSNKKIATVGKTTGKITAKAVGRVTLTATDIVSGKKASVTISIVKK